MLSFEHTHPPLVGQRPSTTQIGQCVQKGLRIAQALGQDAGGRSAGSTLQPVAKVSVLRWRFAPMGAASSDVDAGAWLGLFDRGTCSRLDHGLQVA